jgi:hypothetical protein
VKELLYNVLLVYHSIVKLLYYDREPPFLDEIPVSYDAIHVILYHGSRRPVVVCRANSYCNTFVRLVALPEKKCYHTSSTGKPAPRKRAALLRVLCVGSDEQRFGIWQMLDCKVADGHHHQYHTNASYKTSTSKSASLSCHTSPLYGMTDANDFTRANSGTPGVSWREAHTVGG